ncbi:peptidylprolyl isomerase [Polynucleobacter sp. AP-Capit-er-40B-B4]|nr:peptidylprolyl isomerase [Polynucleobacter sp. AP-Capit-er-40B-B4]
MLKIKCVPIRMIKLHTQFNKPLFVILLMAMPLITLAQTQKSPADYEFVASVNGSPISKGLLEFNLKGAISQGQKDSPQLRQAVKEELINRELIAQAAIKEGLEKNIDLTDQVVQLKQTLLLQAYLEDHFKKEPITDAKLREEYEKQKKLMGDNSTAVQYKVSQIILPSESEALGVIVRLQKGESFSKLAKETSIDNASKEQGGSVGWILPQQILRPIADVMVNLPKGSISNSPIQVQGGWVIIKLEDKRTMKVPTFEEAKNQLRQAVVQQYLAESIKRLRESAKIVQ